MPSQLSIQKDLENLVMTRDAFCSLLSRREK